MKALKALVIGMGLLILVGIAVVIATLIQRAGGGDGGTPGFGTLHLGLAGDCRIAASESVADLLVLRLSGPAASGCGALLVIDPEAGELLGRIVPGAAPQAPGPES